MHSSTPRALARSFNRYIFFFSGWSKDDKYLFFNKNKGPVNIIYSLPFNGGKPVQINSNEKPNTTFSLVKMNSSGTKFGFVLSGTRQPEELYVSGIKEFKPIKISSINDSLPLNSVAEIESIKWDSLTGHKIESLLTYPLNY